MVTLGTTGGFVSSTPSGDPGGTALGIDDSMVAVRDVSPAAINTITEMGIYINNATQETNFEVGVYTDEGNDEPEILLVGTSRTNAKGTEVGWKIVVGLNITISPETTYWLALQVDDTATQTQLRHSSSGGSGIGAIFGGITTLPSDWGTSGFTDTNAVDAIYALTEDIGEGVDHTSQLSETLSFSDSFIKNSIFNRTLSNTLNLSDSLSKSSIFKRTLSENLTFVDSLAREFRVELSLSETLNLSDSLSKNSVFNRSLSDTLNLVDALITSGNITISLSDTLTLVDSLAKASIFNRNLSDNINLSDSLSPSLGFNIFLSNNLTFLDSLAHELGVRISFTNIFLEIFKLVREDKLIKLRRIDKLIQLKMN